MRTQTSERLRHPATTAGIVLGKLFLAILLAFLFTVLLSLLVAIVLVAVQPEFLENLSVMFGDPWFAKGALWAQMIGMIGAAVAMYRMFEKKKGWSLGLRTFQPYRRTAEGAIAGVLFITASCSLIWALGGVQVTSVTLRTGVAWSLLGNLLLFAGVAVNEELFTRGYVQGLLRHHYGVRPAIALSSACFALLHAWNPGITDSVFPMLNLLLAGFLFGIAREVSGSLWAPIGMHLTWNYAQGNLWGFPVSGMSVESLLRVEVSGDTAISGGAFGAEGSVVTTIILVAAIWLTRRYYAKSALSTSNL